MKKNDVYTVNRAREFLTSELFFSTTDAKGQISSWNDVFCRVAGYKPDEIKGKPHNIVRHPDMPRCVFQLFWDYLLSAKSIGAYVKNRAVTGEYYWVYALASPIPDGFLSIRIKPTSPLLATIESAYTELLNHEAEFGKDWRSGMQSSALQLGQKLKSLGFKNYDEFMTETLKVELGSRRIAMHGSASKVISQHEALGSTLQRVGQIFDSLQLLGELRTALSSQETFLVELDLQLNRVALNSGVRAAHLGTSGLALGVIGEEISRVAHAVTDEVETLKKEVAALTEALKLTTFHISLALLQSEMENDFSIMQARENLSAADQVSRFGARSEDIRGLLSHCAEESVKQAFVGISQLSGMLNRFDAFLDSLNKILLTVQFAYVTGKTQASRVEGGETFSRLLTDLRDVSESARRELVNLGAHVDRVRGQVGNWQKQPRVY